MSDSVDRVFVHALATVRRLPRTGSSRPPPSSRLRLYGLYKQSMEGNVEAILPRPTLPVSSPDPNAANNTSVHRYASRDLRIREAQAEIEKWDAWHACAGMSRTEAKRQYISTLIDTMKEYASGTAESRELVSELEFVWNQIKNQTGSDPDNNSSPGNSQGSPNKESPTRKMERAGLGRTQSQVNSMSFSSNRPSIASESLARRETATSDRYQQASTSQTRLKRTESGLRLLSPVSQHDTESAGEADRDVAIEDLDDDDDDENLNTAPTSPLANRGRQPIGHQDDQTRAELDPYDSTSSLHHWQQSIEAHLSNLKTEIAALREQLAANHLLSSSSFSHTYYTMSSRQRILHRLKMYARTAGGLLIQQVFVQMGIPVLVLLWGRIKGDTRLEYRCRDIISRITKRLRQITGGILFWILDLFGRDGRLSFIGRLLRLF